MSNQTDIRGRILCQPDGLQIGRGVVVEEDMLITGKHGPAERVVLGDYCFIGRGTRILAPQFRLGHYSKLHANAFGHGALPLQIGRNCWIGGGVVLDSMGGLDIDDNVGIGSGSQLWTHIQFGDVVEGCRFQSTKYMYIGRDAWFVGHCLVSPVRVGERSMAMLGSVITKDMEANHVYGGAPAVDLTAKLGTQFEAASHYKKAKRLWALIEDFTEQFPEYRGWLKATERAGDRENFHEQCTCFDVSTRTYNRTYSEAEVAFLKQYTPLVKFTAAGEAPFITRQDEALREALYGPSTPLQEVSEL